MMNITRVFNKPLWSICYSWVQKPILVLPVRFFSALSNSTLKNITPSSFFPTPPPPLLVPSCGLKVRGTLQLRCKDCYFARRDGEVYVLCSSFPRHKQIALKKRMKYRRILTYAFQSKYRPY